MMKNKKITRVKKSKIASPIRFKKATQSYKKILREIDPYISETKAQKFSTEGKWQTSGNLLISSIKASDRI